MTDFKLVIFTERSMKHSALHIRTLRLLFELLVIISYLAFELPAKSLLLARAGSKEVAGSK